MVRQVEPSSLKGCWDCLASGGRWAWCYVDEVALDAPSLSLPHRNPYPGEA